MAKDKKSNGVGPGHNSARWHEGQTILMAAFKKKRPVDAPEPPPAAQADLEEAIAGNA